MAGISKRVSGSWVNGDYGIMKTSTDTLTTLPAVLYPNDTTATVGLKGNMSQSGTPSPTTPIQPSETGERTGNLLQNVLSSTEINGVTVTVNADKSITVNGGLTVGSNTYVTVGTLAFESGEKYTIDGVSGYTASTLQLFTVSSSAFAAGNRLQSYNGYVTRTAAASETCDIRLYFYPNVIYDNVTVYPQIVKGDVKPYEPYGVKIPISSASTTTPVYLGEVQTTRQIKKLVLTGEVSWQLWNGNYYSSVIDRKGAINTIVCSHFINSSSNGISYNRNDSSALKIAAAAVPFVTSVSDLKTWLGEQYTNGTPVTIWYVFAEPTTGIVNEPLRKIGDYADTLSNVTIPVTAGGDTLSVGTTLQPSEVTVNYKGWHPVQSVHEKSKNLFDKSAPFAETGKYLEENGSLGTSGVFNVTDFIECEANTDYALSNVNVSSNTPSVCFYDSTQNFISGKKYSGSTGINFITPSTCKYLKFSVRNDKLDEAMLNEGSTPLPYEPYWT